VAPRLVTPRPPTRGYTGSLYRAILYLALLFLARCWDPDAAYRDALLLALGVWLAFFALACALRGWALALGADPCCSCEDDES
jgi:hypothetical protein